MTRYQKGPYPEHRYRDPYDYKNNIKYNGDPRKKPTLFNRFAKGTAAFAGSMALFGIAMSVVGGAGRMGGSLIKHMVSGARGIGKVPFGSVISGIKSIASVGKNIPVVKNFYNLASRTAKASQSIGSRVVATATAEHKAYSQWKRHQDLLKKALFYSKGGSRPANVNREKYLTIRKNQYYKDKFTSFWTQKPGKNNYYGKPSDRAIGLTADQLGSLVVDIPKFYAANKLLSVMPRKKKDEPGQKRGVLENIGNFPADFLSETASMAPMLMAWRGLGSGFNLAREGVRGIMGGIAKAGPGDFAASIMHGISTRKPAKEVFNTAIDNILPPDRFIRGKIGAVAKGAGKMARYAKSVIGFGAYTHHQVDRRGFKELGRIIKDPKGRFDRHNAAYQRLRERQVRVSQAYRDPHQDTIDIITNLKHIPLNAEDLRGNKGPKFVKDRFYKALAWRNRNKTKKVLFFKQYNRVAGAEALLGYNRGTGASDAEIDKILKAAGVTVKPGGDYKKLGEGFYDIQRRNTFKGILKDAQKRGISLLDQGIYVSPLKPHTSIDLRAFRMNKMIESTFKFIDQSSVARPGGFHLGSLFGVRSMYGDQPATKIFGPGERLPVGVHPESYQKPPQWAVDYYAKKNASPGPHYNKAEVTREEASAAMLYLRKKGQGANKPKGLVGHGIYETPRTREEGLGMFIAGRVFNFDFTKATRVGGGNINPMHPVSQQFNLHHVGYHTHVARSLREAFQGDAPRRENPVIGISRGLLNFTRIIKDGPLGRMFRHYQKYFSDNSPRNVGNYLNRVRNNTSSHQDYRNINRSLNDISKKATKKQLAVESHKNPNIMKGFIEGQAGAPEHAVKNPHQTSEHITGIYTIPEDTVEFVRRGALMYKDVESMKGPEIANRLLSDNRINQIFDDFGGIERIINDPQSIEKGKVLNHIIGKFPGRHRLREEEGLIRFMAGAKVLLSMPKQQPGVKEIFPGARMPDFLSKTVRAYEKGNRVDRQTARSFSLWFERLTYEKVSTKDIDAFNESVRNRLLGNEREFIDSAKNLYDGKLSWHRGALGILTGAPNPSPRAFRDIGSFKSDYVLQPMQKQKAWNVTNTDLYGTMSKEAMIKKGILSADSRMDITPRDLLMRTMLGRFNTLWSLFGLNVDPMNFGGPAKNLAGGMAEKTILPAIGLGAGIWGIDKLTDVLPIFEGTMFDEGIINAGSEMIVQGRLGAAKLFDMTGTTKRSKYYEGLMPGSINSPLMKAARGLFWAALSGGAAAATGGASAAGIRTLGFFGAAIGAAGATTSMMDLTKSNEELQEIYSGRQYIPVRKGARWELSLGPYQGGKVESVRPIWFARQKAKYRNTPDDLGSPAEQLMYGKPPMVGWNPLGWALGGGNHYAYNQYYSSPFPSTAPAFMETSFIGPALAGTIGKIIQPPQNMHERELEEYYNREVYSKGEPGGEMAPGLDYGRGTYTDGMFSHSRRASNELQHERGIPGAAASGYDLIGQQVFNLEKAAGLWGWGTARSTAAIPFIGFRSPFESEKVMADSSLIDSYRREYWDKNLGGLMGTTELFRRFVPQDRYIREANRVNPLMNTMPSWMPMRYRIGAPEQHLSESEFRLPGAGYETARDVIQSFPVSADVLGLSVPDMVRKMLGLYPHGVAPRENDLERLNEEKKAASVMYDPHMNISASMDRNVSLNRKNISTIVKTLSDRDLETFNGLRDQDVSEMNFILHEMNQEAGFIQYQHNGRPIAMEGIKYSERRWERDIINLSRARERAQMLSDKGIGFRGEGYSHIDRLKILADTAPWSAEYGIEKQIVEKQIQSGNDLTDELTKIERLKKMRLMQRELHPYRFKLNQLLSPDPEVNIMSFNENIKAAADYSLPERLVGSIWEKFSHLNTPLHAKFLNIRSPRESYERGQLYGRENFMWEMDQLRDSVWRGTVAPQNMGEGIGMGLSWGTLLGGVTLGPSAAVGAAVGGLYGMGHGFIRNVTGQGPYIPRMVQKGREINAKFDKLTYYKNKMMYDNTKDSHYRNKFQSTLTHLLKSEDNPSFKKFYDASAYSEKSFLVPLLGVVDEGERTQLMNELPLPTAALMGKWWNKSDNYRLDIARSYWDSKISIPQDNWGGWDPSINLDDIKLKTIRKQGLEAHDFGLGWEPQLQRMRSNPYIPDAVKLNDSHDRDRRERIPQQSNAELRHSIEMMLRQSKVNARVSVTPSTDTNLLQVVNT